MSEVVKCEEIVPWPFSEGSSKSAASLQILVERQLALFASESAQLLAEMADTESTKNLAKSTIKVLLNLPYHSSWSSINDWESRETL